MGGGDKMGGKKKRLNKVLGIDERNEGEFFSSRRPFLGEPSHCWSTHAPFLGPDSSLC